MFTSSQTRKNHKQQITKHLDNVLSQHRMRDNSPELKNMIIQTSAWQSERIGQTYADVAKIPRFHDAILYFQHDMYGTKDYSKRDHDVKKIYPIIERLLPNRMLQILTYVLELNALTMQLDQAQAQKLEHMNALKNIEHQQYATAYRLSASKEQRSKQIDLVLQIGDELNRLAGKQYLMGVLRLSRKPAQKLGIGELHGFLERGYHAFMKMKDAKPLIKVIYEREHAILNNIFNAIEKPFSIDKKPIEA